MVFDYEDLLVIGVLFDFNLKEFWVWMIWDRFFEILDEEMRCSVFFKTARSVS